jgi:hypothetical protein
VGAPEDGGGGTHERGGALKARLPPPPPIRTGAPSRTPPLRHRLSVSPSSGWAGGAGGQGEGGQLGRVRLEPAHPPALPSRWGRSEAARVPPGGRATRRRRGCRGRSSGRSRSRCSSVWATGSSKATAKPTR